MHISLIVAMDRNGLIGNQEGLPWHLTADLRRFRKLTTGKPIIMGRKTLEHIGGPLMDRLNIVLTRQAELQCGGCVIVHSFEQAIEYAKSALPQWCGDEIMVIGGAEVYRQALPFVDRVYVTIVEGSFTGNTWFPREPAFNARVIQSEDFPADEKNQYAHRFLILDRDEGADLFAACGVAASAKPQAAE